MFYAFRNRFIRLLSRSTVSRLCTAENLELRSKIDTISQHQNQQAYLIEFSQTRTDFTQLFSNGPLTKRTYARTTPISASYLSWLSGYDLNTFVCFSIWPVRSGPLFPLHSHRLPADLQPLPSSVIKLLFGLKVDFLIWSKSFGCQYFD